MSIYQKFWKRVFDVTCALVALVILSPILVIVAVLVRIKFGSPVIFRQARTGRSARPFTLLKFRTMTDVCNTSGELLSDEKRLTPLGDLLRRTSLDELPELLNVLRNDMSLVGPRPLLMQYLDRYTPEQARRHEVLPGITGWAQVNGRNAIEWSKKFTYDVWYVDHWSLWLDLKILFLTVGKVFRRHGISNANHATMPEFMGNSYSVSGKESISVSSGPQKESK
jgi:sugar transferase EpsL